MPCPQHHVEAWFRVRVAAARARPSCRASGHQCRRARPDAWEAAATVRMPACALRKPAHEHSEWGAACSKNVHRIHIPHCCHQCA